MQVLKAGVKNKILEASEKIFYKKDYRSAKLAEIAEEAGIPVALIYSYFKNKQTLFDETVQPAYHSFILFFKEEESLRCNSVPKKSDKVGEQYVHQLIKNRKKLIILMDKSVGTKHEKAKSEMVKQIQKHIEMRLESQAKEKYDPMLSHILASNFAEGLLEIARHYKSESWARDMLKLMAQYYFMGVQSL